MNEFPAGETRLTIAGPEGDLQAITNCPQNPEPGPGNVTIVCHPHTFRNRNCKPVVVDLGRKGSLEDNLDTVK